MEKKLAFACWFIYFHFNKALYVLRLQSASLESRWDHTEYAASISGKGMALQADG